MTPRALGLIFAVTASTILWAVIITIAHGQSVETPPRQYQGEASYTVQTTRDINALCGPNPRGRVVRACTLGLDTDHPRVVLPNPCGRGWSDDYAALACHEQGHVNGWRHPVTAEDLTEEKSRH